MCVCGECSENGGEGGVRGWGQSVGAVVGNGNGRRNANKPTCLQSKPTNNLKRECRKEPELEGRKGSSSSR